MIVPILNIFSNCHLHRLSPAISPHSVIIIIIEYTMIQEIGEGGIKKIPIKWVVTSTKVVKIFIRVHVFNLRCTSSAHGP